MIPILLGFVAALGAGLAVWAMRGGAVSDPLSLAEERMLKYSGGAKPTSIEEQELALPFSERVLARPLTRLRELVSTLAPEAQVRDLAIRLEAANGSAPGQQVLDPALFITLRIVGGVVGTILGLVLGGTLNQPLLVVVLGLGGAALGQYVPELWLTQRIRSRQSEIEHVLGEALDLLTVSVEAGLDFDQALARVGSGFKNAFGQEAARVLRETSLGKPRDQALMEMALRTGSDDVKRFAQTIIEARGSGAPIAAALRQQSAAIALKRRSEMRVRAAQAPLKMLFPTVGCIFPTIWLIFLGPAAIGVLKLFVPTIP